MNGVELFLAISFLFLSTCRGQGLCHRRFCDPTGPEIRFPFQFRDSYGSPSPGRAYPGFELSCNIRNQTIISLPASGDFIVSDINYSRQTIHIRDPSRCLPNRVLQLTLDGSPFQPLFQLKYTFLNCSLTENFMLIPGFLPIACLSTRNYSVIARSFQAADIGALASRCLEMFIVSVPVQRSVYEYGFPLDFNGSLVLTWPEPSCTMCERRGGICKLKNASGLEIICTRSSQSGLPRSVKYGIIIGVGIPGLVFVSGILCYVVNKMRAYRRRVVEISPSSVAPPPMAMWKGLDTPSLDSLPKTILGESRRMAGPNDGTCPICLSEYQPKEAIRIIPECQHCFHLLCVDEWLKMNASCPLCRNSPDLSSTFVTSSSSFTSSMSPSSSFSHQSINL